MKQMSTTTAQAIIALCGSNKEIPVEAKYMAQDDSGEWYAYTIEPRPNEVRKAWTLVGANNNVNFFKLTDGSPVAHWVEELYELI